MADKPKYDYVFIPLPDITTYELAQIMAVHLRNVSDAETIGKVLDESCFRHLKLFRWNDETGEKEYV